METKYHSKYASHHGSGQNRYLMQVCASAHPDGEGKIDRSYAFKVEALNCVPCLLHRSTVTSRWKQTGRRDARSSSSEKERN